MRRFFLFILMLLVIGGFLLAPSYLRYRQTRGAVPPGMRLGGLDFGSADAASVTEALGRQFDEPVSVYYVDQRILLRPEMVDFQIDAAAMLADAAERETPGYLLRLWLGRALNRPPDPLDVPLKYKLDREKLDAWLGDIASRYDRAPVPPQTLNASIVPGQPGWQLDLPASGARVITALTDPHTRTANLVVRETASAPVNMGLLKELLQARMDQFPGIAGLFLHHVPSGEEIGINADIAFSGAATMKLVILEELFRKLSTPPAAQTELLISQTVSMAGNESANELLAIIGDGDAAAGVKTLDQSLHRLGLRNTYMAAPYGEAGPPQNTPANTRADLDTHPDPYVQTTPRDMGIVMQMLVECSRGGGTLLAAYTDQISPAKCQQILDYLKLNEVTDLILSGLPEGTRAVHRHGYTSEVDGDVAVIWGPTGPYVLSIFLYRPSWLEWKDASQTMGDLSRIIWNYFTLAGQQ